MTRDSQTPREPLWVRPAAEVRLGAIAYEGAEGHELELRGSLEMLDEGGVLDLRAVREAVRSLHSSGRFARVAAFLEPMAAPPGAKAGRLYVKLIFAVAPILEIRSVTFPGHKALAESVLKSTANLSGAFHPAQLERAVADVLALYKRAGYPRATITVVQHPVAGGVALELQIREGAPIVVADVRFLGDPGLPREDLLEAFRIGKGDVWNEAQGEEGVRALRERYRKELRLRARVDAATTRELPGGRVLVVVPVHAGPRITFHARGNRAFPDRVLLKQLPTDSEEQLDAQGVQELAARLRRFYVAQGFLRARILTREFTTEGGEVQVFFSIFEDKPVRVERITFSGNNSVASARLLDLVEEALSEGTQVDPGVGADPADVERTGIAGRAQKPSPRRYHVDPSTVFDPALYQRAVRQIEDLYKSEGYLNVQVGPPKIDQKDGASHIAINIPVREGEQARVATIRVEGGGGSVSTRELEGALALAQGGSFSYLAAEEGRGRITQLYTGRGHLYAKVEDEETFDEPDVQDGKRAVRVHVTYRIQPGPLVKVSLVKVESPEGLRTVEGLILNLVNMKPGDVLTPATLDRAQQALLRTGLFFSATLTPLNPQLEEEEKVVQVSLRERPTQSFLGSLGFSLNDGPRTTLQFQQTNLGGRNLTFTAIGKADFPFLRDTCTIGSIKQDHSRCDGGFDFSNDPLERVIDLGLSTPRLYPWTDELRGGVDLIHQRATLPSYYLTKYSAQVTAESVQRRPFSAGLAYEVGYQVFEERVDVLTVVDPIERRLFLQSTGSMVFGSLRPTLTLDLRDEPGRTRKGFFAQLQGDFMRSLTSSSFHVNLFRTTALAAGYLPLPLGSSLLLSARAGYVAHLDPDSRTPGDRRFYLGGAASLRGFPEDALQPEDARAQLHHQIAQCRSTLSNVACTTNVLLALQGNSSGGDVFWSTRAEARIALGGNWELAIFYDVGNLLSDPGSPTTRFADILKPHDAAGSGVRYATPIGRMALDLGVNLRPDSDLGERVFGLYFSIDTL